MAEPNPPDPGDPGPAGRGSRDRSRGGAAPTIAVIGGSRADEAVLRAAEAVGREIARAGAALVCGGLGGVMEAACRGAAAAGGLTIGILPGTDPAAANPAVQVAIPTGLGDFRNFLVVQAAAGVVALPGAAGTLSEAAMARTLGKPLVVLGGSPPGSPSGTPAGSPIAAIPGARAADSPAAAVALALRGAGLPAPTGAAEPR